MYLFKKTLYFNKSAFKLRTIVNIKNVKQKCKKQTL